MKKSWIVVAAAIPLVVFASIAVWKASGDDSRRQGALGSSEAVTLSWRGDWTAEAEYAAGNVVSHEGGSYVAEGEKLSAPVADCTECGWKLMAAGAAPAGAASGADATAGSGGGGAAPAGGASGAGAAKVEPVISGYEVARATRTAIAGASGMSLHVTCPAGKMPLSGGATPNPPLKVTGGGLYRIDVSGGVQTGTWAVQFDNTGGPERDVDLWAVCATVT